MSRPKITRNALKEVIKECLIEILAEGITPGATGKNILSRKSTSSKKRTATSKVTKKTQSPAFDNAISKTTSALTSDPVMAAIFEDTARTTLQEQREAPGRPSTMGSPEAQNTTDSFSEDLFEGSSNWAKLAFTEKKPV